jgi:hypothetical protein
VQRLCYLKVIWKDGMKVAKDHFKVLSKYSLGQIDGSAGRLSCDR